MFHFIFTPALAVMLQHIREKITNTSIHRKKNSIYATALRTNDSVTIRLKYINKLTYFGYIHTCAYITLLFTKQLSKIHV